MLRRAIECFRARVAISIRAREIAEEIGSSDANGSSATNAVVGTVVAQRAATSVNLAAGSPTSGSRTTSASGPLATGPSWTHEKTAPRSCIAPSATVDWPKKSGGR